MPRKVIARNRTELAKIASELDGKYKGLSRKDARTALKHAFNLELVAKITGAKSVLMPLIRQAKKDAIKFKVKRIQLAIQKEILKAEKARSKK